MNRQKGERTIITVDKPSIAGTLESSDIMIKMEPRGSGGIQIELKSSVIEQFGDLITEAIKQTCYENGVENVFIDANDKGALDCTVKARVTTAIYRGLDKQFNWEEVDVHEAKA